MYFGIGISQTDREAATVAQKWRCRPEGSNWGEFGPDDQLGRLNYLTEENTLKAAQEIKVGKRFCLSLPLDVPRTNATNARRHPPEFKSLVRNGEVNFNLPLGRGNPGETAVNSDDAVIIYNQHSTQWDAFAHKGSMFDANGDGEPEPVHYNGHSICDENGKPRFGEVGAWHLGIEHMARACVQGRGVLLNLKKHYGEQSHPVSFDDLMYILDSDGIQVERADILCVYTGYADLLLALGETVPEDLPRTRCSALDGRDEKLLRWIDDTGIAALASDNRAVEYEHGGLPQGVTSGAQLPIHELCLFKLGIHLGEMFYLSELAEWLSTNNRYRFFLSAPPLHLPGAVGSPANPIGTV